MLHFPNNSQTTTMLIHSLKAIKWWLPIRQQILPRYELQRTNMLTVKIFPPVWLASIYPVQTCGQGERKAVVTVEVIFITRILIRIRLLMLLDKLQIFYMTGSSTAQQDFKVVSLNLINISYFNSYYSCSKPCHNNEYFDICHFCTFLKCHFISSFFSPFLQ